MAGEHVRASAMSSGTDGKPVSPGRSVVGEHLPQLDAVRGLAILAVLAYHLDPEHLGNSPFGWIGVRLFFVLSGFLITGILLRGRSLVDAKLERPGVVLRQFYIRRFLRIFPIYYGVIFGLALVGAAGIRENLLWHLFYLSNIRFVLDGYYPDWVAHFWSLAVEEQFYLLWPAMILFLPERWLMPAILLAIAAGPAHRLLSQLLQFQGPACEILLSACLDSLGMGALTALMFQRYPDGRHRVFSVMGWGGLVLYAAILVLQYTHHDGIITFSLADTALAAASAGLIAGAAKGFSGPFRPILEFKPLVYIGVISYGLYVFHEVVNGAVSRMKEMDSAHHFFALVLQITLTFLVAALSWHLFERPINRLKRFFPYRSTARVTSTAQGDS